MAMQPYAFPPGPHTRRHGPYGYTDYTAYKDWLRDEFQFRCAFCLHREKWERGGWRDFHIDHIIPQSIDKGKYCTYENLLYSCKSRNVSKSDRVMPDPSRHDYSTNYKFEDDGTATPTSDFGDLYIAVLKLNEPYLVNYRRDWIRQIRMFEELLPDLDEDDRRFGLTRFFGYPDDIPDLRSKRPVGNSKPNGVNDTYFLKLSRVEIEPYY